MGGKGPQNPMYSCPPKSVWSDRTAFPTSHMRKVRTSASVDAAVTIFCLPLSSVSPSHKRKPPRVGFGC